MLTLIIIAVVIIFLGLGLIGYLVANALSDIEMAESATRNILRVAHSSGKTVEELISGDE